MQLNLSMDFGNNPSSPSITTQRGPVSSPGLTSTEAVALARQIHGFMHPQELAWLYEQAQQMDSIVEIGSWLGRSTTVLCHACPGTVYTVDHWRPEDPKLLNIIRQGFYAPGAFRLQMQPFIDSGKLVVIQENSLRASRDDRIPQHPDMIFIDGEHDYLNVNRDIALWAHRPRKLLCGHDYLVDGLDTAEYDLTKAGFPDVKKAVDAKFPKVETPAGTLWAVWQMMGLTC